MYSIQNSMAKYVQTIKLEQESFKNDLSSGPFLIKREKNQKKMYEKGGQWVTKEIAKYVIFIDKNYGLMEGKPHSQLWEVYKRMGKFIKSRNFRQCKTYHQKLILKYHSIPEIIDSLLRLQPNLKTEIQKEKINYDAFAIKDYENQIGTHGPMKADKLDFYPTDCNYQPEDNNSLQKPSNNKSFTENQPSFKPFNELAYQEPFKPLKKPTAEDWLECHNLFLQYMNKLNEIKMKEW